MCMSFTTFYTGQFGFAEFALIDERFLPSIFHQRARKMVYAHKRHGVGALCVAFPGRASGPQAAGEARRACGPRARKLATSLFPIAKFHEKLLWTTLFPLSAAEKLLIFFVDKVSHV